MKQFFFPQKQVIAIPNTFNIKIEIHSGKSYKVKNIYIFKEKAISISTASNIKKEIHSGKSAKKIENSFFFMYKPLLSQSLG